MNTRVEAYDFFVVGSGIGGLMSALHLAEHGRVLLVTKKRLNDCNTNQAQGGIACVVDAVADSFEQHIQDTLVAGAGLCDRTVVEQVVSHGPARIAELVALGVQFNRKANGSRQYDLGREGGHTQRRILHAGDRTGQQLESVLVKRVLVHPNIQTVEYAMVIDLITTRWLKRPGENRCVGAYVLDQKTNEIYAVRSPCTILATGGCGKVYLYTCNPDIATGDGIALAWRAGARIANMEFIQFHPTCLYHPHAKRFLISEAVRGEGAELVDAEGRPFMQKYDARGALAPRDIVARAIDSEMKRTGAPYCCLDIRHKSRAFLKSRFPNIYETCLSFGIDITNALIPIVPSAHYCCGGIQATVDGRTSIEGLYAVGETACTGLHGANRLASNSLLEAVVGAYETANRIVNTSPRLPGNLRIPNWEYGTAVASDEAVMVAHNWMEVRTCMWDYVGIVRTSKRLMRASRRIRNLRREIRAYYFDYLVTADMLELRNLALVAELIVRSAMRRRESRGLHYTLDFPTPLARARDTLLTPPPPPHQQPTPTPPHPP
ncbi:MAG: L-aspartate oxidase, partial [Kiritimatiellaeota bacterium]|nr:L-aspartate oxidase [Kiritimatiellota bacterium]